MLAYNLDTLHFGHFYKTIVVALDVNFRVKEFLNQELFKRQLIGFPYCSEGSIRPIVPYSEV